jgi:hypothetical protein
MRDDLHPLLNRLPSGISEFTFANLYLFRGTYGYRLSRHPGGALIVEGAKLGKSFFYVPDTLPPDGVLAELMGRNDYWKNLSEAQEAAHGDRLRGMGWSIAEDRDNFDYIYRRQDLVDLAGKTYHKKRNLVHAFNAAHVGESRPLTRDRVVDALGVLAEWAALKGEPGDVRASREAVEQAEFMGMSGCVYYVEGVPVGWCLGETVAAGTTFAIHFEKGLDHYKGVYQFINQDFAKTLPESIEFINREQDLGDEGLRQAKMTYRPAGFVKKYRVTKGG